MGPHTLKNVILLLYLTAIPFPGFARQLLAPGCTVGPPAGKPIIDTGMLYGWPRLAFTPPVITTDANYLAYIIKNEPVTRNTLVIRSSRGAWKKEFITNSIDTYFFSKDDKRLYWKSEDTLFFLILGQDSPDHISHITALQFPRLNKGEWIAYQLQNTPGKLLAHNLVTGKIIEFSGVTDYLFDDSGSTLLVGTGSRNETSALLWFSLNDQKTTSIWCARNGETAGGYNFDRQGHQLAFMVKDQHGTPDGNEIWLYKTGMKNAVLRIDSRSTGLRDSSLFIANAASFSRNGKWLFFQLRICEKGRRPLHEAVKVRIWSYKDKLLYRQQAAGEVSELLGITATDDNSFIYICQKDEQIETGPDVVTGDHVVLSDRSQAPFWWPHLAPPSYWLVSLHDGDRTLIKKHSKLPVWGFTFSPAGTWLVYWDSEQQDYISYNIREKRSHNITDRIPPVSREQDYIESFYNSIHPQPIEPPVGWYAADDALLIYDRYDIWKLDPAGLRSPVNITNGYGARHHIKLRFVYGEDGAGQHTIYSGEEPIHLTAFNTLNKHNGFFSKDQLDADGDPIQLTMGPYIYYLAPSHKPKFYSFGDGLPPIRSGDGNKPGWIVQRSSATEAPNYFFSEDLVHYAPLTHLQPQRKYNWLSAELVTWQQLDGTPSQGVLYKPENFDPRKKYPVIFNYYEMLSHRLYGFPWPGLTNANINIPWFVSRGYLVFTPDVHFSRANSKDGKTIGEAAYNSIESAAIHLSGLPYVNGKKMALQGHSFGGGITNDLITRSHRFAAACSVAGTVGDQISAYLGLVRATTSPPREYRMDHSEAGHDRIGATLWERPDLYIRASPVFRANDITTPLLIMHNQEDQVCDWGQSAELYMALRRLGKKAWMLQYEGEGHSLSKKANATDFTIRLTQFFDHYLKDTAPPSWMEEDDTVRTRKQ